MARSVVIFLAYYVCDGPGLSRWLYLDVATVCCLLSAAAVSAKALLFWVGQAAVGVGERCWVAAALFLCSVVMTVAHVMVAYRTSCRERRKLNVLSASCVGFCGEKKIV